MEFFDDTVGWAHGAVDVMRAAGHSPFAVHFDRPSANPRYVNMRAQMWMEMSDWIKDGGCLPKIPELIGELTAPTYFFNGGKFQIESKDQIKKRLAKSPDLADALALTFSLPDAPGGMYERQGAVKERRRDLDYDLTSRSRTISVLVAKRRSSTRHTQSIPAPSSRKKGHPTFEADVGSRDRPSQ